MGHNREPIKHTCPDIDKLIKSLSNIQKSIKDYQKIEDIEDLKDMISDIENEVWGFEDKLEDLRRANDTLRSWGIEEAEEVDKLENKIYSLEHQS